MNATYVRFLKDKLEAARELVAEYVIALKVAEREATRNDVVDVPPAIVSPKRGTFRAAFASFRA